MNDSLKLKIVCGMVKKWKQYDCLSNPKNCNKDCVFRSNCEMAISIVNETYGLVIIP